jgi:hypothetical protein
VAKDCAQLMANLQAALTLANELEMGRWPI